MIKLQWALLCANEPVGRRDCSYPSARLNTARMLKALTRVATWCFLSFFSPLKMRVNFTDLKNQTTLKLPACKNNGFSWHFQTAQFHDSMFHLTFKKSSVSKKLIGKSSWFQELVNTSCMRTQLQQSKTLFKKARPRWVEKPVNTALGWTAT